MPGCRCAMSRRQPRTRIRGRRSARAGPRQPGPARDLHRRRLPRRCRPVGRSAKLRPAVGTAGQSSPRPQSPSPSGGHIRRSQREREPPDLRSGQRQAV
jgi:hypothetical protein